MIDRFAAKTGHVQIADNPGRGAPGTGTLPLARPPRPAAQGRLRGLGRPGVQAGRPAERRGVRLAAARSTPHPPEPSAEHARSAERRPRHEQSPQGRLDRPRHHGLPHVREPDQGGLRRHRIHPGAGQARPSRRRRRHRGRFDRRGRARRRRRDHDGARVTRRSRRSPTAPGASWRTCGRAPCSSTCRRSPRRRRWIWRRRRRRRASGCSTHPCPAVRPGAVEAVLSIMVGGEQADFDTALPALRGARQDRRAVRSARLRPDGEGGQPADRRREHPGVRRGRGLPGEVGRGPEGGARRCWAAGWPARPC